MHASGGSGVSPSRRLRLYNDARPPLGPRTILDLTCTIQARFRKVVRACPSFYRFRAPSPKIYNVINGGGQDLLYRGHAGIE